ncbi:MAG: hypothetical protein ACFFB5_24785 [Promethearchaeota archaeon]
MKFEGDVSAPILRYDIPSPSTYEGRHYIELDIGEEFFRGEKEAGTIAYKKPSLNDWFEANRDTIDDYLSDKTPEDLEKELCSFGVDKIDNPPVEKKTVSMTEFSATALSNIDLVTSEQVAVMNPFWFNILIDEDKKDTIETKYEVFKYLVKTAYDSYDKFPSFYRTMGGTLKLQFISAKEIRPRLLFIETYKLTSFPGDYGAGLTLKTFSLLPGEETEISIKTWKKTTESIQKASSILDSYTEETADEFESGVQSENSRSSQVQESESYHVEAEAKASWGWGSAKVSGGYAGGSNSSREQFSKNVMNATENHSQSSSAKRDVNIDTSYTKTEEVEEEEVIMRRIKNLNASRALNFVFRQMNQEFHTILHLIDVRIAFFNGYPGSMKEYALYEIEQLVSEYMKVKVPPEDQELTKKFLGDIVKNNYGDKKVFDYQGKSLSLVEEVDSSSDGDQLKFLRIIPPRRDPNNPEKYLGRQEYVMREEKKDNQGSIVEPKDVRYVDGVIVNAKRFSMRTDSVIVESMLGKAPALDEYALNTQIEVLRNKELENEKIKKGLDLIDNLIGDGKINEAITAYQKIFVTQPKLEEK